MLLSRLSHCCASDGCIVSNPRSLKFPQFEVVKPSPPSKCDGSCVGTGACTADRSARCPLRPTRTPQYAGPRVSFPGILESGAGSDAQNPRRMSTARVLALSSVASLTTRRICTADPAHLPRDSRVSSVDPAHAKIAQVPTVRTRAFLTKARVLGVRKNLLTAPRVVKRRTRARLTHATVLDIRSFAPEYMRRF